MRTIEKRADELQPGDILVGRCGERRVVLLTTVAGGHVSIYTHAFGKVPPYGLTPPPPPVPQLGGQYLRVEAPELLPAEIDALAGAARQLLDLHESGDAGSLLDLGRQAHLSDLLDRLRPPEPPTLAEALALLAILRDDGGLIGPHTQEVVRMTERARCCGLLPKEGA